MKKALKYFVILVLAVGMVACSKESDVTVTDPQTEPSQEQTSPENETSDSSEDGTGSSDLSQLDPTVYLLGFGVHFENDVEPLATVQSKADIDMTSGIISLEGGESVLVRSGEETGKYIFDSTEQVFAPEDESQAIHIAENIEVYYPYDSFVLEEGKIVFTMPALVKVDDTADLADKNPMGGFVVEKSGVMTASLKNLGAVLSLNFVSKAAEGETITAVEISAGDDVKLTGKGEVSWNGTGEDAVPTLSTLDGEASVRINLTTPVQLTPTTGSTFYFFLPVANYAITCKAIFGKDGGYEPYNKITRAKAEIQRSNILRVSSLALPGFFSGGDGSAERPYKIATADDFNKISTLANATEDDGGNGFNTDIGLSFFTIASYEQTANIGFGDETISSIGTYNTAPFKGIYDGKNYTLSNFKVIGTSESSTGLFEYLEDATIKNLNISGSTVTGADAVGTLAGRCIGNTLIENCSLNKDAASSQCIVQGANATGGLVAHLTGTASVKGCSINGTVVLATAPDKGASNSNNQGGIIGYSGSTGEISNCTTAGTISFTNESAGKTGVGRGGIIGNMNAKASILSCTNGATFTTTMDQVGGIVGIAQGSATVGSEEAPCYNTASITGADQTGGIVGHLESATVQYVTNSGSVTGAEAVGGLVGYVSASGVLQYSHNITGGDVKGTTNVGGIAGTVGHASASVTTASTVMNCRVDGVKVTATNEAGSAAGGIAGLVRLGARVRGCSAFRGEVSGHQDVGGCIGLLYWYNIQNTNSNARILVSENIVGMDVKGLDPINNTARIGGFLGWFRGAQKTWNSGKTTYTPYIFVYQNGVVGGTITAENCEYVGSFVGYLGTSLASYRIYDSYSLIDDSKFIVTQTNNNVGGFFGGKGGTIGVNRDYFVVSQNTSAAVTGITKIDASDISTQTLSNNTPTLGSQITLGGWSNQGDVTYPVPTLLVDFGYYK